MHLSVPDNQKHVPKKSAKMSTPIKNLRQKKSSSNTPTNQQLVSKNAAKVSITIHQKHVTKNADKVSHQSKACAMKYS